MLGLARAGADVVEICTDERRDLLETFGRPYRRGDDAPVWLKSEPLLGLGEEHDPQLIVCHASEPVPRRGGGTAANPLPHGHHLERSGRPREGHVADRGELRCLPDQAHECVGRFRMPIRAPGEAPSHRVIWVRASRPRAVPNATPNR